MLGILESVPAMIAFIWGAAVGSFLNVVIWRLPRRKSLSRPASHCPRCGHALGLVDNIPIYSYLRLRGKCRHCGVRISPRYMIIEIINGLLWSAIVYHFMQLHPWPQNDLMHMLNICAYLVFTSALLAALAIDLESYIIPDELNNFALFTGIGLDLVGIVAHDPLHQPIWGWLPRSIAGAVICAGIFVFIQLFGLLLFRKDAMGDGDVKLARAIGAMLPLGLAVTSFVLAIALGAVIGGSLIAVSSFLPKKSEENVLNSSDQSEGGSILELSNDHAVSEEEAEVGVKGRTD